MNAKICRGCKNRCHVVKDEQGRWFFLTQEELARYVVKVTQWSRPKMYIRHDQNARAFRYIGGTECEKMALSEVPDELMLKVEPSKECQFYAEHLIAELNE